MRVRVRVRVRVCVRVRVRVRVHANQSCTLFASPPCPQVRDLLQHTIALSQAIQPLAGWFFFVEGLTTCWRS